MPHTARRMLAPLVITAIGCALAAESATAATATVVRVIDGDTLQIREGGRLRNVDLLGVDAPEARDCHGNEAKRALRRLAPAGARVRAVRDSEGARSGRYLYRGRKLVNADVVRSGDARAAGADRLDLGSRLVEAQRIAKQAGRGLWAACPETQPQPQPAPPAQPTQPALPPGVVVGDEAKQRARGDLAGRVVTRITTTTFSSSESRLHLCSDGSFVEDVETYSDFGGSTYGRYRGQWEVLAAEYRSATDVSARVRRLNEDGSEGFLDIVAQGGRVTANGSVVSVQASGVCS